MTHLERMSMLWGIEARIELYSDDEARGILEAVDRADTSYVQRTGRTVMRPTRSIATDRIMARGPAEDRELAARRAANAAGIA